MKKILISLLALGFVCLSANDISQKPLTLGMSADYPPFEYINDKNEIDGFEVELIKAISDKIGVKFNIKNISFDGLIVALKSGKIDAIMSAMSATDERRKSVDFTNSYFTGNNIWIKKLGSTIKNKTELNGKKVAAQIGTLQEAAAHKVSGSVVIPTENVLAAVMQLKSGKIDALVTDQATGENYMKQNSDIEAFLIEPDGSDGLAIAFDKGKHTDLINKINQAIKELKDDGTIQNLINKFNIK